MIEVGYCPPLTDPDEFGLVWDSTHIQPHELKRNSRCRRLGGMLRYNPRGMAIFATREARTAAMNEMIQMGFRYMVTYRDVNGHGLSWCFKPDWIEYTVRPSRRRRLPSYRVPKFLRGPSLYRNPAYDLVNDPILEPHYA